MPKTSKRRGLQRLKENLNKGTHRESESESKSGETMEQQIERRKEERRAIRKLKWKKQRENQKEAQQKLEEEKEKNRWEKKTFLDEFRELILHQHAEHTFGTTLSETYRDEPTPDDFEFFVKINPTSQLKFLSSLPENDELFKSYIAKLITDPGYISNDLNSEIATFKTKLIKAKNFACGMGVANCSDWVKIKKLKEYIDNNKEPLTEKISTMPISFLEYYKSPPTLSINSSSSSSSSSINSKEGGKRKKKKTKRKTSQKKHKKRKTKKRKTKKHKTNKRKTHNRK